MKRITVYCGSNDGLDPMYKAQAYLLGQTLAQRDIELVYGGAQVGLMGAIADGALEQGGKLPAYSLTFYGTKKSPIGNLPNFSWSKPCPNEKLK